MDKSRQKDGSRNSDGNVPNGNWNSDKFYVNWYNTDNRNDNLRPREEISQKSASGGFFDYVFNPCTCHFSYCNHLLRKS